MLRAAQQPPRGFPAIKRCLPHALLGRSLADEGPVLLLQLRGFAAGMQEVGHRPACHSGGVRFAASYKTAI